MSALLVLVTLIGGEGKDASEFDHVKKWMRDAIDADPHSADPYLVVDGDTLHYLKRDYDLFEGGRGDARQRYVLSGLLAVEVARRKKVPSGHKVLIELERHLAGVWAKEQTPDGPSFPDTKRLESLMGAIASVTPPTADPLTLRLQKAGKKPAAPKTPPPAMRPVRVKEGRTPLNALTEKVSDVAYSLVMVKTVPPEKPTYYLTVLEHYLAGKLGQDNDLSKWKAIPNNPIRLGGTVLQPKVASTSLRNGNYVLAADFGGGKPKTITVSVKGTSSFTINYR